MKKKILLYGNCQMRGVWQTLNHAPGFSDNYELIHAEDYDLPSQGNAYGANPVAGFMMNRDPQDPGRIVSDDQVDYRLKQMHKALNDTDLFIAIHQSEAFGPGTSTASLLDAYGDKPAIILPSFWFGGYLTYHGSWTDFIIHFIKSGKSYSQIKDLIYNENLPIYGMMSDRKAKFSLDGYDARIGECLELYNDFVDIRDYVRQSYKTELITYNHSHPTDNYFKYLYERIVAFNYMENLPPVLDPKDYIHLADNTPTGAIWSLSGPDEYLEFKHFKFYRECFPHVTQDIANNKNIQEFYNHTCINNSPDEFFEYKWKIAHEILAEPLLPDYIQESLEIIEQFN